MENQTTINIFELEYRNLLDKALEFQHFRDDRTGVGSYSLFSEKLEWNISNGLLPMITGRKIYSKIFFTEFLWFLNGETNIKRFQDEGIKIWDAWADRKGELGRGTYGDSMIRWNSVTYNKGLSLKKNGLNQFKQLIDNIINNPESRRHIISLWNPSVIDKQALPPCYHNFQFYINTHNKTINMHVLQRSADLFLGIPYDVNMFSLFLEYVAQLTNYKANRIVLTMVDAHVYKNQVKSALEYLKQDIAPQPNFILNQKPELNLEIKNYKSFSNITAKVAV